MNLLKRSAALAVLGIITPSALWGQTPATNPSEADRLQRLEERLNSLDQHYQEELKKRDQQIESLRQELQRAQTNPAPATPLESNREKAMQQITQDILNDIETRKKDEPLQRLAASANPDIAVIVDFLGLASSRNKDAARNRMDVREAELDIRASVDPRADAVLVLAFARDAAPALFEEGEVDKVETAAELEEGYLFLHDFGVPNMTARVGRYHVRFGRQNVLHLHDLPTSDSPFVLQSFLAPEALTDAGFEFSYVIPNPFNEYIELITELNSGEGAGSESPTLRGGARAQSP